MQIELKILNKGYYSEDNLPTYATVGSAAVDLIATENATIAAQQRVKIPTGLAIWIGSMEFQLQHYAGIIAPRSGLGTAGLVLANTIGVIDESYQGEIVVAAWNALNEGDIKIKAGDRFAQLFFIPIVLAQWSVVDEFSNKTERGVGGFGHTGE